MAEPIVNNQTAPSLEAISGIESLGQADGVEVFTTTAQTGKDWYAIYFVTESVISAISSDQATGESALITTIPAGMTLFMRIQSITLTSGLAIGYQKY
jgi:hypothetical protein|tara:strand:- start:48 stop:341 length:294 start_codon:yes stop_codon:yes gene_type:complete